MSYDAQAKQAEQTEQLDEIDRARQELEAERALFAAQKQAWQLLMQTSGTGPGSTGQYLPPDPTTLRLKSDDTYEVRPRVLDVVLGGLTTRLKGGLQESNPASGSFWAV